MLPNFEFIDTLRQRGLIAQISHEQELKQLLADEQYHSERPFAFYCGVDPTAPSLHLGNLVALLLLRRAQDAGFVPIIVFGGATGMIGDPTGRTEMRPMNSVAQIHEYIENFKKLANRYFNNNVTNKPIFLNNFDWIGSMTWLQFARDVGVHFTIARLLAADVNRTRFQEGGLTFMELGYQLLQAYDFLHLYKNYNCVGQFGGADQWSNILAGADLIRRVEHGKAFAITTPLLVASDGSKFGKSAGNAIWLDPSMTSPYEFFQFLRNVHDQDVEKMFLIFTFFPLEQIAEFLKHSNINETKEKMAFEITKLVHGEDAAAQALQTSKNLFSHDGQTDYSAVPKLTVTAAEVHVGLDILDVLVRSSLCTSRGEARKLVIGGGIAYNAQKITDFHYKLKIEDFLEKQGGVLIRKGKKEYLLITLLTN